MGGGYSEIAAPLDVLAVKRSTRAPLTGSTVPYLYEAFLQVLGKAPNVLLPRSTRVAEPQHEGTLSLLLLSQSTESLRTPQVSQSQQAVPLPAGGLGFKAQADGLQKRHGLLGRFIRCCL